MNAAILAIAKKLIAAIAVIAWEPKRQAPAEKKAFIQKWHFRVD